MRKLGLLTLLLPLVAVWTYGCEETTPTDPTEVTAPASLSPSVTIATDIPDAEVGASLASVPTSGGGERFPFWRTRGNPNTEPAANFLGTTDNQPLVFRTNGTEAIRVVADGRVGVGTMNPEGGLHVSSAGDFSTPQLTLQQTGVSGFSRLRFRHPGTSNFWDITTSPAAGQFGIYRRGVGGIVTVTNDRSVGINTSSPTATLHVRKGTQRHELMVQETSVGAAATIEMVNTSRTWTIESDADPDRFRIINYFSAARGEISILAANGYVGIGEPNPGYPLEMRSGAHVTAGGVWTDASSRAYKENIRDLTTAEALTALAGLTPVRFNYLTDEEEGYVGFIAEDVPELVATGDRTGLSPMDIVAVLTKVVQQQQEKITELEARLDAQQ